MIYALTFFGIILGSSFAWRLITGDFPKGAPLVVIWIIALIALVAVGYKRLYLNQAAEPADEDEPVEDEAQPAKKPPKQSPAPQAKKGTKTKKKQQ